MQVRDGIGHAYPRSSAQKRKQCLWVRAFLCLRSKRLHVQETGLLCFLSVPLQRSYTAPTAASLHCVDTSICPSFFMAPYTILQCMMMALALCSVPVDLTHNSFRLGITQLNNQRGHLHREYCCNLLC